MSNETRPLLVLVDGHAVAYRAFFALRAPTFVTSEGEPTNATYGFTRVILDILEENPTYFAVSFDRGLSGRENLYPDYKANREDMPQDLVTQMGRIEELVKAFNIPVLAIDGYEADDVIGTITQQAEALGCDIRIVSGDRDMLQLVSDHTLVQLPQRGDEDKVYGVADFAEKYPGLTPPQLTDLKGLMGDSSDNIPGVKGIGEKGALKLLQDYKTLEGIYEHIENIKGALRTKLETDREMAFLSRQLATIYRDIPITLDLKACLTHDYDAKIVDELFAKLEFRTFRRQLHKMREDSQEESPSVETVEAHPPDIETIIVDSPEKLTELVEQLKNASVIAFDTETTGVDQMSCNLVGISLAVTSKKAYYIPVGHIAPNAPEGTPEGIPPNAVKTNPQQPTLLQGALLDEPPPAQLPLKTVIDSIRPALTNPHIEKIGHNAKYDLVVLRRYGIDVTPIPYDTMIAEWLTNPDSRSLGLKNLALQRLNITMTQIDELLGEGRNKITMARVPIEQAAPYAAADVALLFPLRENINLDTNPKLNDLFNTIEMPLVPIVADIEMKGVLLDLPYLEVFGQELAERLSALEQRIYSESGYGPFNINSLNQLADVLFGKLKLSTEGLKKTKTGNYSLRADVLDTMRNEHPIIPLILDYRQLAKLKSTYVDALPAIVNPYTGRVHTSYNQTGAATGRFSSSDPNLQNIPIRTEEGRRMRRAFIAPEGHKLLSVDYSQIELRILAHYSGDQTLLEAFEQGQDIHASTAAAVYHIPIQQVTFEQRSFAKSVNFGLMYGMGAFRLARDSDLTYTEAKDFIEAYFERFPGVKHYLDQSKAFAAEYGYVETLYGRRRNFHILKNPGAGAIARQTAEREAINMPIQGTAADILKIAMVNLAKALKANNHRAAMILQVHDELVLEVPDEELNTVAPLVVEIMESAVQMNVKLKAEANVGQNWRDMEG